MSDEEESRPFRTDEHDFSDIISCWLCVLLNMELTNLPYWRIDSSDWLLEPAMRLTFWNAELTPTRDEILMRFAARAGLLVLLFGRRPAAPPLMVKVPLMRTLDETRYFACEGTANEMMGLPPRNENAELSVDGALDGKISTFSFDTMLTDIFIKKTF
jgi:hypothetical protein